MSISLNNKRIYLIDNSKIVHGINRSILINPNKSKYFLLPKEFAVFLSESIGKKTSDATLKMGADDIKTINENLSYLEELGYILLSEFENFVNNSSPHYNSNQQLSNAIVYVSKKLIKFYKGLFKSLHSMSCKAIQLIFVDIHEPSLIVDFIAQELSDNFHSIELTVNFTNKKNVTKLIEQLKKLRFVQNLIILNSEEAYNFQIRRTFSILSIQALKATCYDLHFYCGKFSKNNLILNSSFIDESLKANSCLNKKVAIDLNGNIKNCPSMPTSYGNIKTTDLETALEHKRFKRYWDINKDQIYTCKDCEFRYVCIDCRAYTENPEDEYSKPLKCGYNPYTNIWEEWSTNPLKQKTIEHYGIKKLISV